jgi:predicted ArsR family transcriptional regulator
MVKGEMSTGFGVENLTVRFHLQGLLVEGIRNEYFSSTMKGLAMDSSGSG